MKQQHLGQHWDFLREPVSWKKDYTRGFRVVNYCSHRLRTVVTRQTDKVRFLFVSSEVLFFPSFNVFVYLITKVNRITNSLQKRRIKRHKFWIHLMW